jgi:UDP-N-acetylglucosamine 2-epimerase (non-hydrolysing)
MKKVFIIIGARPNFMKAFPVYEALKEDFALTLIHTGQHFDAKMSDVFFNQLKFPRPDIHLSLEKKTRGGDLDDKLYVENEDYLKDKDAVIKELMSYEGDLGQLGEIRDKLNVEFEKGNPDLVIVFGDVTSTLAAGLAARKLNIDLAHVESGLRSGDLKMPEEVNRVLTDHITKYYFVTEQSGIDNLKDIGITENVYLVGNTMIDTQKKYLQQALDTKYHETLGVKSKGYVLITLHRPSNVDDLNKLKEIVDDFEELSKAETLVYPIHPRTKNNLEKLGYLQKVQDNPNIILDEPLGYLEFTCLMANCKYVVTDSGGIQEESSALNIACFTLRENTERPSTFIENNGTNQLINKISEIELKECKGSMDLWDGISSLRINTILNRDFTLTTIENLKATKIQLIYSFEKPENVSYSVSFGYIYPSGWYGYFKCDDNYCMIGNIIEYKKNDSVNYNLYEFIKEYQPIIKDDGIYYPSDIKNDFSFPIIKSKTPLFSSKEQFDIYNKLFIDNYLSGSPTSSSFYIFNGLLTKCYSNLIPYESSTSKYYTFHIHQNTKLELIHYYRTYHINFLKILMEIGIYSNINTQKYNYQLLTNYNTSHTKRLNISAPFIDTRANETFIKTFKDIISSFKNEFKTYIPIYNVFENKFTDSLVQCYNNNINIICDNNNKKDGIMFYDYLMVNKKDSSGSINHNFGMINLLIQSNNNEIAELILKFICKNKKNLFNNIDDLYYQCTKQENKYIFEKKDYVYVTLNDLIKTYNNILHIKFFDKYSSDINDILIRKLKYINNSDYNIYNTKDISFSTGEYSKRDFIKHTINGILTIGYIGVSTMVQKNSYINYLNDNLNKNNINHLFNKCCVGGVSIYALNALLYITKFNCIKYDVVLLDFSILIKPFSILSDSVYRKVLENSVSGLFYYLYKCNIEVIIINNYRSDYDNLINKCIEQKLKTEKNNHIFEFVNNIGKKYNFKSIDIDYFIKKLILEGKYKENELSNDGIHCTNIGNELISDYIYKSFQQSFQKKKVNSDDKLEICDIPNIILPLNKYSNEQFKEYIFNSSLLNINIVYNKLSEGSYNFKFDHLLTSILLIMDAWTVMNVIINDKTYQSFNKELPISILNHKPYIIEIDLGSYIKPGTNLEIKVEKYKNICDYDYGNNKQLFQDNKEKINNIIKENEQNVKIIGFIGAK